MPAAGRGGVPLLSGRVLGIQIRDSMLVALTEAGDADGDGIHSRHFDVYRIRR